MSLWTRLLGFLRRDPYAPTPSEPCPDCPPCRPENRAEKTLSDYEINWPYGRTPPHPAMRPVADFTDPGPVRTRQKFRPLLMDAERRQCFQTVDADGARARVPIRCPWEAQ